MDKEAWDDAARYFEEALSHSPHDIDTRRLYVEALWNQGERTRSIQALRETVELDPDNAQLRLRLAEMGYATGDMRTASHEIREALEIKPKNQAAWTLRGLIFEALNSPEQALADYHRALQLDPTNQRTLFLLAELHYRMNRHHSALASLHLLSDTYPPGEQPIRLYELEGLNYLASGQYGKASRSLTIALQQGEPSPFLWQSLARAEFMRGEPMAAERALQASLAMQPDHPASLELLQQIRITQAQAREFR
ncbi:Hypothetical protein PBC10988_10990 [Planctomycetales bacterium 10988]|nr:Hypothetical protein PBC10988_10990 [Planctomycetales bacterium 10988]